MTTLFTSIINILTFDEMGKYFKRLPNTDFILNTLLPCYGLKNFEDTTEIINDQQLSIMSNLIKIVPQICLYVNDFVIKKLFVYNHVSFYKSIVLLKNFLNCFNMTIKRKKKSYKGSTKVFYSIIKFNDIVSKDKSFNLNYTKAELLNPFKSNKIVTRYRPTGEPIRINNKNILMTF